ncbi:hypothetical protein COI11_09210 [Neisseria meningitidis]|nr:hypothetical protein COI23_08470 [Neisseria meningitidis]RQJ70113.1 hypothetical protein COI11_09210 [Neisseria meningitidis]RQK65507.1 hypothetical protein COH61_04780 [Neisseria meningitidis]RQK93235.1 hypothetical protein COH46_03550 [Neisseria meningitidis]
MVYGGVKRPDGAVSVRNGSDFVGKMGGNIFCRKKYLFKINQLISVKCPLIGIDGHFII